MVNPATTKINKPRLPKKNGHRALKACDSCRRMKTRCIPSPIPEEAQCLRCDSLKLRCSFQDLWENNESGGEEVSAPIKVNTQRLSNSSKNGSRESAELTKRLLKSGYSPEHFAVHSKLLQNVNKNVSRILNILENQPSSTVVSEPSKAINFKAQDISTALRDAINSTAPSSSLPNGLEHLPSSVASTVNSRAQSPSINGPSAKYEHCHSTPYLTCPFTMMSQMVSHDNIPLPIRKLHEPSFMPPEAISDVVDMNLLTLDEVTCLVQCFRDGYGKWCSFPEIPSEKLVSKLRSSKSSLLLSTICVLALRYTTHYHDMKTRIYKNLLYKLRTDLELSLRIVPQTVEFVQAAVILSLYAYSLSSDIMSIDAWYISGIGLQQFLTLSLTGEQYRRGEARSTLGNLGFPGDMDSNVFDEDDSSDVQFQKLQLFRLWNHLCMVHITNCVLSGRMCIIDGVRADLCRRIVDFPKSTHYDGMMVAEISLQLILYNFVQQCSLSSSKDLEKLALSDAVQDELHTWYDEWKYLLSQPIYPGKQYADFALDYGHTIVLYIWCHKKYRTNKLASNQADIASQLTTSTNSVGDGYFPNALNAALPIKSILGSMSVHSQFKMLGHAHKSVEAMISDSFKNFRFLSDQLIFQCVQCSLTCLLVAHNLYYSDAGLLREEQLEQVLSDVKKFSLRLQKIREGELKSFWVEEVDLRIPSIILQYHKAIEASLQDNFSEYEIQVDDDYL
ncbi:LADA_0F14356g1_1 [Lachancea dasiensis]|uniref:LADA_0F14356g1_1 n=1 Tax=Lachancea dasiensis TaxID=1072105 RepID=A0A1G4JN55_9SACH|nr:LADA_0F14356g1_1 [Lachancea dasiensis]